MVQSVQVRSWSISAEMKYLPWIQRDDEAYVAKYGKWKTFHVGSNLSCRQHIRSHYAVYQKRCAEQDLKEHHHAVPQAIARAKKEAKKQESKGQQTLTGFWKTLKPGEFSKEAVLKVVAEFVVCDDQVQTSYLLYLGLLY